LARKEGKPTLRQAHGGGGHVAIEREK